MCFKNVLYSFHKFTKTSTINSITILFIIFISRTKSFGNTRLGIILNIKYFSLPYISAMKPITISNKKDLNTVRMMKTA